MSMVEEEPVSLHVSVELCEGPGRLTLREGEIVALGAQGATDKEIADQLAMSMPTLRTHWSRLRDKLGASNRTHAIVLAAREQSGNVPLADDRTRLVEELYREKVSSWIWHGRRRHALLDDVGRRLFCLTGGGEPVDLDHLIAHVWAPDRARFARFLTQAGDLRPMTPIEMRVGVPGDYRNLVRTVNLAAQSVGDSPTLLLATTAMHVFDSSRPA